ncbi:MAG: DUF1329 domain-containing protein [Deltaproteobacteria bacterium]|nr:DUF1329 domain-containing protein [Deltaproteobacteria bacterium]
MKEYKELNYWQYWTRRNFLKAAGAWAGAGMLQPVLSLIGAGKSIAAAYPDEVLSIEKYTKGRVKPGMVISKDNAGLIKDLVPEGLYVELTRGREIRIAETTLQPDMFVPDYWIEATLRNKGRAVIDKKGQLWTKDGMPWIGGDPFPEAQSGLEAMWNHIFSYNRYDSLRIIVNERNIDSDGTLVRDYEAVYSFVATVGRVVEDPKPYLPLYKGELYRVSLGFFKPFDVYGLTVLSVLPYDAAKLPETILYIPTLRRTRRVPSTQRFEPVAPYATQYASDLNVHNDPLLTWSWQLVGRKPMLYPAPVNTGLFAEGATERDFVFPYTDKKFPRTTWELRPEVLLVDGVPHIEGAPYSKRRMYVDAIAHRAECADMWDKQGKIWKWSYIPFLPFWPDGKKGRKQWLWVGLTFADVQRDYRTNIWILPRKDQKFNAGLKVEDYFSDSALLRLGRR